MQYKEMEKIDQVHYQLLMLWLRAIKNGNAEDVLWYADGMRTVEQFIPDVELSLWQKVKYFLGV